MYSYISCYKFNLFCVFVMLFDICFSKNYYKYFVLVNETVEFRRIEYRWFFNILLFYNFIILLFYLFIIMLHFHGSSGRDFYRKAMLNIRLLLSSLSCQYLHYARNKYIDKRKPICEPKKVNSMINKIITNLGSDFY